MRVYLRVALVVAVITPIVVLDTAMSESAAMSLSFTWDGVAPCTSSPPAFALSGVPAGTSRLAFNMVDLNVPSFPHGGGSIAYRGENHVAAGSFPYQGPCPPAGQRHNYRWTVQAIDAAGKTLATASAVRPFPPR
jgi:phosphatidylethanolamine-binding protein (PEBP) family uncharacterized protein